MTAFHNLPQKVLLVGLTKKSKSWTVTDKATTADVISDKQAMGDAGRWSTRLISKRYLRKISSIHVEASNYFREHTLEWRFTDGARLCPVERLQSLKDKMDDCKARLGTAVRDLIAQKDEILRDAQITLGKLYSRDLYPDDWDCLYDAYDFDFSISALPDRTALERIFVGRSNEMMEQVAAETESRYRTAQRDALRELAARIIEPLHDMVEKMDALNSGEAQRLKAGTLGNVRAVVEAVRDLNIDGDARLTNICNEMARLGAQDDDSLRGDGAAEKREEAANHARKIIGLAEALKKGN